MGSASRREVSGMARGTVRYVFVAVCEVLVLYCGKNFCFVILCDFVTELQ